MNKKNNLKKFGHRLKELREKSNFTQAQLAEQVGLSTNFVGMVERGDRNTTIDKMFILITALNISPSEFFENFK